MKVAEFDRFAEEYRSTHAKNIALSGESPDFFAEYKVIDACARMRDRSGRSDYRILDFGAGVGNSIPYFAKHAPGSMVTCLDVSRKSLDVAASRFPGMAELRLLQGEKFPCKDGEFDLAFVACVFHHIDQAEHHVVLRELLRVLRPGGTLTVFEHNPWNPLTRHAVRECPFDQDAVLLRAPDLRRAVVAAGFSEASVRFRIFFPGALAFLRGLERAMTKIPLGAQYYVMGRK